MEWNANTFTMGTPFPSGAAFPSRTGPDEQGEGEIISRGGWPGPSHSLELTRVPRPSSAWAGPLSGRMLPHGWKDICLLSPPRGPTATRFLPTPFSPGTSQRQRTGVSALHEPIFGTGYL